MCGIFIIVVSITLLPPVLAVYHPSKVYPVFVKLGSVPYVLPYTTFFVSAVPVPPFLTNDIVIAQLGILAFFNIFKILTIPLPTHI